MFEVRNVSLNSAELSAVDAAELVLRSDVPTPLSWETVQGHLLPFPLFWPKAWLWGLALNLECVPMPQGTQCLMALKRAMLQIRPREVQDS